MQNPVQTSGRTDGSRRYLVPAVVTATRIMDLLAAEEDSASLAELSRRLRLPKSSVRTVALTLTRQGWLEYDARAERYRLGPAFAALARGATARVDPIALARPHLEQIAAESRLTCVLVRRLEQGYVLVDKVESPESVRVTADVGVTHPWRGGALARAFLAFLPDAAVAELALDPASSHGDRRGVSDSYRDELQRTRREGYTVSVGEVYAGVNAVAAPVPAPASAVPLYALAAIGTSGTLPLERARQVGTWLREAAGRMAGLL